MVKKDSYEKFQLNLSGNGEFGNHHNSSITTFDSFWGGRCYSVKLDEPLRKVFLGLCLNCTRKLFQPSKLTHCSDRESDSMFFKARQPFRTTFQLAIHEEWDQLLGTQVPFPWGIEKLSMMGDSGTRISLKRETKVSLGLTLGCSDKDTQGYQLRCMKERLAKLVLAEGGELLL